MERNVNIDVVVVGAGITGITTAHLFKETGLTVALIERERVASMDTGHTTAHLTCITDVELQELARNFGDDHAQAAGMQARPPSMRSRKLSRMNR